METLEKVISTVYTFSFFEFSSCLLVFAVNSVCALLLLGSVGYYCLEAKPASCFLINSATIKSIADSIPLLV